MTSKDEYEGLPDFFRPLGPEPYPDCEVTRKDWGALPSQGTTEEVEKPVRNVLFTHTESDHCDSKETCIEAVKALQQKHLDQGLCDIRHNYLVGGDGNVYEGRGWNIKPEVSQLYPEIADSFIDVGYIGYKGIRPEKKQNYAGKSFVKDAMNWERVAETPTFYSDL